jgi:hypothetical protein
MRGQALIFTGTFEEEASSLIYYCWPHLKKQEGVAIHLCGSL